MIRHRQAQAPMYVSLRDPASEVTLAYAVIYQYPFKFVVTDEIFWIGSGDVGWKIK